MCKNKCLSLLLLSIILTVSGCISTPPNNHYPNPYLTPHPASNQYYRNSPPKVVIVNRNGRSYRVPVVSGNIASRIQSVNHTRKTPVRSIAHSHRNINHLHPLPNGNQINHRHGNSAFGHHINQPQKRKTYATKPPKLQPYVNKPKGTKQRKLPINSYHSKKPLKQKQVRSSYSIARSTAHKGSARPITPRNQTPPTASIHSIMPVKARDYGCAKRYCTKAPQVLSCSEAHHKWKQCGDVSLDRDDDGIPCENFCGKTINTMMSRIR